MAKYDIAYFRCRETGFLQTETPYWLEESYASPMNLTDTGILQRNIRLVPLVGSILSSFYPASAQFVDYAGGYGIFTRLMRDAGFDYYWQDAYTPNLCARGFEFDASAGGASAVTAFEVLEHLPRPQEGVDAMCSIAPVVIFTTLLLPDPLPAVGEWWYYGTEHGQHVSFYTTAALERIASASGRVLVSNGFDLHMFVNAGLVPRRIAARWLHGWLKTQPDATRDMIRSAYRFETYPYPVHGRKDRIRNVFRRREFPGWYLLAEGAGESARSSLAALSLGTDYATHLVRHGAAYWPYIAPQLHSRTMDDLVRLRQIMERS
jgi:hypothetical protein